jgi:hypothetical protein
VLWGLLLSVFHDWHVFTGWKLPGGVVLVIVVISLMPLEVTLPLIRWIYERGSKHLFAAGVGPTTYAWVSDRSGRGCPVGPDVASFGLANPAPFPPVRPSETAPCTRNNPDAAAGCSAIPQHVTVRWRMPESQRDSPKVGRERCSLTPARVAPLPQ